MKKLDGFSLIEVLVVLGIFAVLTVLVSQSVLLTLRSARKSEAEVAVRSDLNYRLQLMQRQFQSASAITSCSDSEVDYIDTLGVSAKFKCTGTSPNISIASVSGALSVSLDNPSIGITACNFICTGAALAPTSITASLTGIYSKTQGIESATQNVSVTAYTHLAN